jgi:hypothetical protein
MDGRCFDSQQKQGIFLFSKGSIPALASNRPHIQWSQGKFSPEAKRPESENRYTLREILGLFMLKYVGYILVIMNVF